MYSLACVPVCVRLNCLALGFSSDCLSEELREALSVRNCSPLCLDPISAGPSFPPLPSPLSGVDNKMHPCRERI